VRPTIVLVAILVVGTANADGWLCVADSAAGFRYDARIEKWSPKTFSTDNKYIIKPRGENDTFKADELKWRLVEFGTDRWIALCRPKDEFWIECDGVTGEFLLQTNSGKFMYRLDGFDFWDASDQSSLAKERQN